MEDVLYKTLIIRFSSIGDIALSSLLVRALRHRFPSCHIDYVVKSEFADLVTHNPRISRVISFPGQGTFGDLRALRRRLQPSTYDLVIDIHDSLRSRYLCLGARRVVRLNKRKLARFLLVEFKIDLYRFFGGAPAVALRYLEPVSHRGVIDDGNGLELFVPPDAYQRAESALREAGIPAGRQLLGVCPAAKHENKIWGAARFADAALHLAREHHAPIVLFGAETDRGRCEHIAATIREAAPDVMVASLAGRLALLETAAAMDRCLLVLTNDSGLMHLAAARKRKVLAVFGPTVQQFGFFPFGTESMVVEHPSLPCRPCTHIGLPACPEGHFRCMEDIPSSRVVEAARHLLAH